MQSSSTDLKKEAFKLLKAHDVADLVWGFHQGSIVEADGQKLVVVAKMEDLKSDRLAGEGVTNYTLCTLGQMVSKVAYMLQTTGDEADKKKWVQNHLTYTHLVDPSYGDDVLVHGTFLCSQTGIHHLQFCIESDPKKKKVIFGTGSSSIAVFPAKTSLTAALSANKAAGEKIRQDGSSRSQPPPPPSSGHATTSTSSARLPTALETTSKPTTSAATSRPQSSEPPAAPSLAVSTPDVVKPSILRRPATNGLPEVKRRRRVSFVEKEKERSEEFMMVNVQTRHPKNDKTLEKALNEIGVTPEEIRFEPLPIAKRRSHVVYFKVTSAKECSRVEKLIQKREWHDHFHIIYLCSENSEPFFWKALPMTSIIEAAFLAQRVALRSEQKGEEDDLSHQLSDKKFLGVALNDVSLTEEVLGALNQKGKAIFQKQIKPQAAI